MTAAIRPHMEEYWGPVPGTIEKPLDREIDDSALATNGLAGVVEMRRPRPFPLPINPPEEDFAA